MFLFTDIVRRYLVRVVMTICAVSCLSFTAFAQELVVSQDAPTLLNVEQAVEQALRHNLALQRDALDVETARQNKDTAFRTFYPQISLDGGITVLNTAPDPIPGLDQPQNIFSPSVSAQIPLHFRIIGDIRLAKLEYKSGTISYEQASQSLSRSVQELFYTLLLLEERIAIGEESIRIAMERATDAQIRFDSGVVDEFTLLTAQVNIINAQTPVDTIRTQYHDAIRRFNVLLGADIGRPIKLSGEIRPDMFAVDSERVVADLLSISPSIRSFHIAINVLEANRTVQITNFLPSFLFSYQYQLTYRRDFFNNISDIGDFSFWRPSGGFTMSVAIPLGNLLPFSQTWIEYYANERELEKARLTLSENTQNLAIQIYSLVDSLNQTARNIQARRINVERAERAFAVAQEGYRAGLRSILEVRDAQNQLDNAQIDSLNERFLYIRTQLELTTQLGIDVDILKRYARESE